MRLKELLKTAKQLYEAGRLADAKRVLLWIADEDPAYDSIGRLLMKIDTELEKQAAAPRKKEPAKAAPPVAEEAPPPPPKKVPQPKEWSKQDRLAELYAQAEALYRSGKLAEARTVFRWIQEEEPGFRQVQTYLGDLDKKAAQIEAQQKQRRAAQKREQLRAALAEAAALLGQGQFGAARAKANGALVLEPDHQPAKDLLAQIDAKEKAAQAKGAADAKAASDSRQQRRLKAIYDNAILLFKAGKYADARVVFQWIAEEDPDYRDVKDYLTKIDAELVKQAQKSVAQREKEEAEARQKRIAALLKDADAQLAGGRLGRAKELVTRALAEDPENAQAKAMAAKVKDALETQTQAAKDERLRELYERGRQLIQTGRLEDAKIVLNWITEEEPDYQDVQALLQEVNAKLQRAAELVERKKKVATLLEGARALLKKRRAEEARALLREAFVLLPDSPEVNEAMAAAEGMLEHQGADKRLQTAYREAKELHREGRYDDAIKKCKEILAEFVGHSATQNLLFDCYTDYVRRESKRTEMEKHLSTLEQEMRLDKEGLLPEDQEPLPRPEIVVVSEPAGPEVDLKGKLNQRVSVNLIDADLSYMLDLLFRSTGVNIIYDPQIVEGKQLTLHVENVPLEEILQYITRVEGLSFTPSKTSIWITTPDAPILEGEIIPLSSGLIDVAEAEAGQTSDLQKILDKLGELIEWPPGSTYHIDQKLNVLYARSTPEGLDGLRKLLAAIDKDPVQVLIEARFIEVHTDDMKDLGIDWTLTSQYAVTKKGGDGNIIIEPGGGVDLGVPTAEEGLNFAIAGVLTDPQFRAFVHALEKTERSKTLSSPKIIAVNNYTAEIAVTTDLIYIEGYEVDRADVSGATVGGQAALGDTDNPPLGDFPGPGDVDNPPLGVFNPPGTGGTGLTSEPVIIPTINDEEDIGIVLRVTPSIGKDVKRITLTITPEIREQVGVFTFPISIPGTTERPPDIRRPVISTRQLTTKLTVEDGRTVVIGGMGLDVASKTEKKVPLLGDIPIIGPLFRYQKETDEKRTLLIFVKAQIIDPSGAHYEDRTPGLESSSRAEESLEGIGVSFD